MIGIAVHGGLGGQFVDDSVCTDFARRGLEMLRSGTSASEVVVAVCAEMEDDGRMNAGSGSPPRAGGDVVEMDAAVMLGTGEFGAVAGIRAARNPIRVASRVVHSPHIILVGDGADAEATRSGLPRRTWISETAMSRYRYAYLGASSGVQPDSDTVGVCCRDRAGLCAVAVSTGGAAPSMIGRIGDCAIPGAALWAGSEGAVAVTGSGEEIAMKQVSRVVYEATLQGEAHIETALSRLGLRSPIGVVALSRSGVSKWSSAPLPWASCVD